MGENLIIKEFDYVSIFDKHVMAIEAQYSEGRRKKLFDSLHVYELETTSSRFTFRICDKTTHDKFFLTIISDEPLPVNLETHNVYVRYSDIINLKDVYLDEFIAYNLSQYIELGKNNLNWVIPEEKIVRKRRIFISQPFTGKDDNEIMIQRGLLFNLYCEYKKFDKKDCVLIEQHLPDDPYDIAENFVDEGQRHFYRFCRSIGMMGTATDVIIYGNWANSRGCRHEVDILSDYHCYNSYYPGDATFNEKETNGVNVTFQNELIAYCMKNSNMDDYIERLWPSEYDKMHDTTTPEVGDAYNKEEENKK